MNNYERFMKTLRGEKTDRVPLFPLLMFIAIDRAGITYRQFATDAKALAETQLMMQDKYDMDAITACSDAFRLSGALGGEMAYPESKPPHLEKPLVTSASDIDKLGKPDPADRANRMGDRTYSVAEMAKAAGKRFAVLGWVDMPFAEACSVCGVENFMIMLVSDPSGAHKILEFLTERVIEFSLAQAEAGADMIGAGDAVASLISPEMYREFALPYEQRVCNAVHDRNCLLKLHICGNTTALLDDMAKCGADLFNVDHMVSLEKSRDVYSSNHTAYKGNLDPVADIMQSTPETCRAKAHECIKLAEGTRYMLSAGCEIPAETPEETWLAFCNAPKTYE